MLLLKYFSRYVLLISLLMFSQMTIATVFEKKCGVNIFTVEIYNGLDRFERKYKLYYKTKSGEKKRFFQTDSGVRLDAACVKNKEKKDLFLFLEYGGGNASAEDRYSIFDPNTNKILIQPISWLEGNYKQVELLLGYSPPFPIYDETEKIFFCCSK